MMIYYSLGAKPNALIWGKPDSDKRQQCVTKMTFVYTTILLSMLWMSA